MTRIKILEVCATVFLIAVVVALLYVWTASPLAASDKVGITMAISTVALVVVTGIYAWHTRKMAEEMREQRYDTFRPVIDFVSMQSNADDEVEEGLNAQAVKEKRKGIGSCLVRRTLSNVGIGPAIDTYSFTLTAGGERSRKEYGTLTINGATASEIPLCPERKDDHWFLVAYYKDVFDRWFESSREVSVVEERIAWSIGQLKIRKIAEEELPK